jgi:hypothetical protein
MTIEISSFHTRLIAVSRSSSAGNELLSYIFVSRSSRAGRPKSTAAIAPTRGHEEEWENPDFFVR